MIAALMSQKQGNGTGGGEISTSIKMLLIAIAVALLAFFGYRAWKKWQEEKETNQRNNIDTSVTTEQVINNPSSLTTAQREQFNKAKAKLLSTRFRAAFNPSGIPWLILTDTTSNSEIKKIAEYIKQTKIPFTLIANAYYDDYKDDLKDRLRSELSTNEHAKFYSDAGLNGIFSKTNLNGLARI